jgi:hypothetical protein
MGRKSHSWASFRQRKNAQKHQNFFSLQTLTFFMKMDLVALHYSKLQLEIVLNTSGRGKKTFLDHILVA